MCDLNIHQVMTITEIYNILMEYDNVFEPPLHTRVLDFGLYARKLLHNAYVYTISDGNSILGFVAFYANDNTTNIGYLSQIAVRADYMFKGIGYELLQQFEITSYKNGMNKLKLEVNDNNQNGINFYKRNGYNYSGKATENSSYMMKYLH